MAVNKDDVLHIAELSKLSLTENEIEKFTGDINTILNYMEKLNGIDTENVEPLLYPVEVNAVLREDILIPSIDRETALKNSANKNEEYFIVPKII